MQAQKSKETSIAWRTPIEKSWPPSLPGETRVGLENKGTDCYRNVIFQTLLHSPVFLHWLRCYRHHHAPDGSVCQLGGIEVPGSPPDMCKLCYLEAFATAYWEGRDCTAACRQISDRILKKWKPRNLEYPREEDPAEYFEALLNQISQETIPTSQKDLDDIFKTQIIEVRKCKNGCPPSYTPTEQPMLRVGFPNPESTSHPSREPRFTVSGAVNQHLERLDQSIPCGSCGNRMACQMQIGYMPEMLLIHVNRADDAGKKITSPIQFSDPLTVSGRLMDERPQKYKEDVRYKLCAVIMYHGDSTKRGHYTVGVKGRLDRWTVLNDMQHQGWSMKDFLNHPRHLSDAYIFAYRRLPTGEKSAGSEPAPLKPDSTKPWRAVAPELAKDFTQSVATLMQKMIPEILEAWHVQSEQKRHEEWSRWVYKYMKTKKRKREEGETEGETQSEERYEWSKCRGLLEIVLTAGEERVLDLEVQGCHFNRLTGDGRKSKTREGPMTRLKKKLKGKKNR